jgi:hypothetical protein
MTTAMRPNRSDDAVPGEPLPAWKRRLFMGITLAIPLVALAAAELGLRLAGWGGYPAFFRIAGQLPSGASVALVEPAATKPYFFANPTRPGYAEETNFLIPKPADTVRIFIVGESAAKGYPQPRNLSMASFLQALLERLIEARRTGERQEEKPQDQVGRQEDWPSDSVWAPQAHEGLPPGHAPDGKWGVHRGPLGG